MYVISGGTAGRTANFYTLWLGGSNSCINPLLYIITMKAYRSQLSVTVHRALGGKVTDSKHTPSLSDSRQSSFLNTNI